MFYNTVQISGEALVRARGANIKQDEAIYELMKDGKERNAWELTKVFPFLITSIRRTLTDLEAEGKIERIKEVMGPMKKPIGVYRIKTLKLF